MSDNFQDKDVNIIKASRMLQAKVGSGDIDKERIAKSQSVIESNKVDFVPLARQFLEELDNALQAVPEAPQDIKTAIQPVIESVMQIKGNAAMFNYTLVGSLASIVLNFLENLNTWDKDSHDIVEAHMKTLQLIVNNGMKGDGGQYGTQLVTELRDACQRYFNKKSGEPVASDVFFVE
ncbi:MAG: hypothetical protein HYS17_00400 [Micavibrio aeruginosavorus]|uniref:Uncharacterized protein n=1 Tax=Micavibrio aeruginosavorus TaxID=349221 RepID=A0A7T5UI36_9BACT|nr:MAG: hypothetical protein HYS17_00400 [Micavibrio aeruginosavorus]